MVKAWSWSPPIRSTRIRRWSSSEATLVRSFRSRSCVSSCRESNPGQLGLSLEEVVRARCSVQLHVLDEKELQELPHDSLEEVRSPGLVAHRDDGGFRGGVASETLTHCRDRSLSHSHRSEWAQAAKPRPAIHFPDCKLQRQASRTHAQRLVGTSRPGRPDGPRPVQFRDGGRPDPLRGRRQKLGLDRGSP